MTAYDQVIKHVQVFIPKRATQSLLQWKLYILLLRTVESSYRKSSSKILIKLVNAEISSKTRLKKSILTAISERLISELMKSCEILPHTVSAKRTFYSGMNWSNWYPHLFSLFFRYFYHCYAVSKVGDQGLYFGGLEPTQTMRIQKLKLSSKIRFKIHEFFFNDIFHIQGL